MRLNNKVAVITGGNSGIGFATAKVFLDEGAKVIITGRNPETLAAAQKELGNNAFALKLDVTDAAATEAAFTEAAQKFGRFDVVFANAGIGGATPLGQTSFEQFNQIISTNLTAVFFTVQSALPHLNDNASVILNGSVDAVLGVPGWGAYAASKGAVRAFTRNFAAELAPRGIRVNQVTPGATKTPIWHSSAPTPDAMTVLEAQLGSRSVTGRMSEPEEIARAALYLASDESTNVTGIEITVDGGMTGAPAGAKASRGD
ncbi:SDR family NAD(P)-dependent oxidoreductase [Ochrobactrum sp. AN78]|uniref:SDR family NAD(P)-dependent oxidoreductase n=1 Tax=Ochrobactrum sp. AN78 TaxID=3039853 RepID=UPI00298A01DB|nr:SDR family oxidoreductase [Ochrobactrum sp. AN78]MDH7793453.1 NAD(P)-dependent dehydrogenase (short-subunit alcohol dehydrogenase family) [Ochrobactrum sp. AN78]